MDVNRFLEQELDLNRNNATPTTLVGEFLTVAISYYSIAPRRKTHVGEISTVAAIAAIVEISPTHPSHFHLHDHNKTTSRPPTTTNKTLQPTNSIPTQPPNAPQLNPAECHATTIFALLPLYSGRCKGLCKICACLHQKCNFNNELWCMKLIEISSI